MNDQQSLWQFIVDQHDKLLVQIMQHLGLTFLSLLIAIAIGLPLGIFIARHRKYAVAILIIAEELPEAL